MISVMNSGTRRSSRRRVFVSLTSMISHQWSPIFWIVWPIRSSGLLHQPFGQRANPAPHAGGQDGAHHGEVLLGHAFLAMLFHRVPEICALLQFACALP